MPYLALLRQQLTIRFADKAQPINNIDSNCHINEQKSRTCWINCSGFISCESFQRYQPLHIWLKNSNCDRILEEYTLVNISIYHCHMSSTHYCTYSKKFCNTIYTIKSNNIRTECLTPYRAVKYDCIKLKGFPCDI